MNFFGACNDFKYAVDRCFKAEKEVKKAVNLERGRETLRKLEASEESLSWAERSKQLQKEK